MLNDFKKSDHIVVVCDIQGFNLYNTTLNRWDFHPKEISIVIKNKSYNCLLKPKIAFQLLSDINKKQVRFEERHIHGLRYSSGDVPNENILDFLNILKKYTRIYIKGHQKFQYLKQKLHLSDDKLINVENMPDFSSIPSFKYNTSLCLHHCGKRIQCSETNSKLLYNWLEHQNGTNQ